MTTPFVAAPAALVTSTLLIFVLLRATLARQLLIDAPNERSSHTRPKPRGGGVGVVGGLAVGLMAAAPDHSLERPALVLLASALICAGVGLWDDLRGLSVRPRLALEFLVATWFVVETGPLESLPLPAPLDLPLGPLGYLFPIVWLVGVMNFFNFMDGIDGLAAGQAMAVSTIGMVTAWSADASLLAVLLFAALAGFLPFNWWPSKIFLGDVGSLPIGFLLAALPLLAPAAERHRAVLATAIGLTLFLLDPVLILWRRSRRGAPLGQPHREHLYQQIASPGTPHAPVTLAMVGVGVALSAIGAATFRWPESAWLGMVLAGAAFAAERRVASLKSGGRP